MNTNTEENEAQTSGYQPRPAAPPSAGRALSVLIAVCAVLWLWLMLPELWPLIKTYEFRQAVHSDWLWMLLPPLANYVVFRWATRLMLPIPLLTKAQDIKRFFVLTLCVLFHMAVFGPWLLFAPMALICSFSDCSFNFG